MLGNGRTEMGNNIKVSIITISYNSAQTIERTIQSVLAQKYLNIEYIIVDGGSTDGTVDVIKKYSDCITWISEKDEGISDAFNKGIKLSSGDLICMMNSDDYMAENAIEVVVNAYEDEVDIYYGDVIVVDQDDNSFHRKPRRLGYFKYSQPIFHQSTYINRRAYARYGLYDVGLKMAMDYELLYKMYLGGVKFKYVGQILATFSLQGLSGSNEIKNAKAVYSVSVRCGTSKIAATLFLVRNYISHYLKKVLKGKIIRGLAYRIADKL